MLTPSLYAPLSMTERFEEKSRIVNTQCSSVADNVARAGYRYARTTCSSCSRSAQTCDTRCCDPPMGGTQTVMEHAYSERTHIVGQAEGRRSALRVLEGKISQFRQLHQLGFMPQHTLQSMKGTEKEKNPRLSDRFPLHGYAENRHTPLSPPDAYFANVSRLPRH